MRWTLLLGAFYVLTSATTTHAACAWVLWMNFVDDGQGKYALLEAHETKAECEARRRVFGERVPIGQEMGERKTMRGYECLPDTIDPRGAKGK